MDTFEADDVIASVCAEVERFNEEKEISRKQGDIVGEKGKNVIENVDKDGGDCVLSRQR